MSRRRRPDPHGWIGPAILVGSLVPFVVLGLRAATGRLGANPVATAIDQLGQLSLILLLATLACTPARTLLGVPWAGRVRRTLGLLAFFAVCCHLLVYLGLDHGFDLPRLGEDLARRPFILIGFTAFVLLIPLAATSTRGAVRALGGRRWRALHRLVYAAAVLGVVHYAYRVKADVTEPLVFAAVLALLLAARVVPASTRQRSTSP